jgi:carbon starvation protein
VGMAQIFAKTVNGRWLDLWYHFAIMFEALFILTTLDAGTRVGRYLLQEVLGHIWRPLGKTSNLGANVLASVLMVVGWGYFLVQGVRDPLGGINSLWPLFGIANQMLASIALCLVTTVILKMTLRKGESKAQSPEPKVLSPKSGQARTAFALITLVPLVWLLAVTMTAGVEKIALSDPRIGFLAHARTLREQQPELEAALASATASGDRNAVQTASKALVANRVLRFNDLLDACVAAVLLALTSLIVLLSAREWILMLARRKPSLLRESEPVWLPDYAIAENRPMHLVGVVAVGLALAKELSGEAQLERARHVSETCACGLPGPGPSVTPARDAECKTKQQIYVEVTENRYNGVRRCC